MIMFYITILRVPLCQETKGDESRTVKVSTWSWVVSVGVVQFRWVLDPGWLVKGVRPPPYLIAPKHDYSFLHNKIVQNISVYNLFYRITLPFKNPGFVHAELFIPIYYSWYEVYSLLKAERWPIVLYIFVL